MKRIALFNHKGGVSKTTTTFNLSWMLALQGKKVIMVDADPQCNLTGLVFNEDDFEAFYSDSKKHNLKTCLAPAFEAQPKLIEAAICQEIDIQSDSGGQLYLLPGHLDLSEYEVTLGIAQELSTSLQTLKNLPGSFSYLFEETAKHYQADYVLIDMNPSLSSINQNLLMTSDYFLLPTSPDYFSVMALKSLKKVLPRWAMWAKKAQMNPTLTETFYPFPVVTPKFLGTIVQKYREREGNPSKGFEKWIDDIRKYVNNELVPALRGKGSDDEMVMTLDGTHQPIFKQFSDFNTLIALSQAYQTPVFALTDRHFEDAKYSGVVKDTMKQSVAKFEKVFSELAQDVIKLTS
jgi:cellulose biosynthesis protein BcsQ